MTPHAIAYVWPDDDRPMPALREPGLPRCDDEVPTLALPNRSAMGTVVRPIAVNRTPEQQRVHDQRRRRNHVKDAARRREARAAARAALSDRAPPPRTEKP